MGVLHNAVHKITSDVHWHSLRLINASNNEMQINESLPYQISTTSVHLWVR
jgi:hypothetical protein